MRKITLLFVMTFILFQLHSVTRTFTINDEQLTHIRNAAIQSTDPSIPIDPLINSIWMQPPNYRDNSPEPIMLSGDRNFTNTFGLETKAIQLYKAIISYPSDPATWTLDINVVRNYLANFDWDHYKLAIYNPTQVSLIGILEPDWDNSETDGTPSTWKTLSAYERAREHSYNMLFLSYMVDMLYYAYPVGTTEYNEVQDIKSDLADLLSWTFTSFFNYNCSSQQNPLT